MKCIKFLLALFLFSCGSKENSYFNDDSQGISFSFEKLDSIRIDFLGNVIVHDLDPESRTVLFTDNRPYSQEIHLAGFNGELINSFSKFGDLPDTYGNLMSTIRLERDKKIIIYGHTGFLLFDFEGNLLSRTKLIDFQPPSYAPIWMGHGMERLGNLFLYVNQDFPPDKDYSDKNIYEDMYLVDILNPETGAKEPIIRIPKSSIFRSGKYFFRNAWEPVYDLDDDLIYVVFGSEPVIYAFQNSTPYSLLSSIPFNLPDYRYFKGADNFSSDPRFFGLRFTSGIIENIKKVGDYFLVAYFPGYDGADTEMVFSNLTSDERAAFNSMVKNKYPHRIAVLNSNGELLDDIVPDGMVAKSMLIRNGELWMMEQPDEEVERDYFQLFRVGIQEN